MPSFSAILHALTAFVAAHPGGAAWLAATLVAVYRSRTPAQWIALGESNPRLQGAIKAARGFGVDPARLLEGAAQVATGRVPADPRDAKISEQAARIAELEAALGAFQRRTADAAEHDLSRPTVTPPAPVVPVDRDSQRGSVDLTTVAAIVTGSLGVLCAVIALAAWSQGCMSARRFVLDHTDGVPARVQCTPRTQVCVLTDAGVYLPSVYSDECRPWPTLPLRPNGTQRTCAAGEGCVVEADGGLAHCTAADGGGR